MIRKYLKRHGFSLYITWCQQFTKFIQINFVFAPKSIVGVGVLNHNVIITIT